MSAVRHYTRRHKIVRLSCDSVLGIFNAWNRKPQCLEIPRLPELPEGYEVVSVSADWRAQCIDMVIYHPSFDLVPEGDPTPYFQPGPAFVEVAEVVWNAPGEFSGLVRAWKTET